MTIDTVEDKALELRLRDIETQLKELDDSVTSDAREIDAAQLDLHNRLIEVEALVDNIVKNLMLLTKKRDEPQRILIP